MEAIASSKYALLILGNILFTTQRYSLFYKVKIPDASMIVSVINSLVP